MDHTSSERFRSCGLHKDPKVRRQNELFGSDDLSHHERRIGESIRPNVSNDWEQARIISNSRQKSSMSREFDDAHFSKQANFWGAQVAPSMKPTFIRSSGDARLQNLDISNQRDMPVYNQKNANPELRNGIISKEDSGNSFRRNKRGSRQSHSERDGGPRRRARDNNRGYDQNRYNDGINEEGSRTEEQHRGNQSERPDASRKYKKNEENSIGADVVAAEQERLTRPTSPIPSKAKDSVAPHAPEQGTDLPEATSILLSFEKAASFITDVQARFAALSERNEILALAQEGLTKRLQMVEKEKLLAQQAARVIRTEKASVRNGARYAVVLVDGDNTTFAADLVKSGFSGGEAAFSSLRRQVKLALGLRVQAKGDYGVHIKVFNNKDNEPLFFDLEMEKASPDGDVLAMRFNAPTGKQLSNESWTSYQIRPAVEFEGTSQKSLHPFSRSRAESVCSKASETFTNISETGSNPYPEDILPTSIQMGVFCGNLEKVPRLMVAGRPELDKQGYDEEGQQFPPEVRRYDDAADCEIRFNEHTGEGSAEEGKPQCEDSFGLIIGDDDVIEIDHEKAAFPQLVFSVSSPKVDSKAIDDTPLPSDDTTGDSREYALLVEPEHDLQNSETESNSLAENVVAVKIEAQSPLSGIDGSALAPEGSVISSVASDQSFQGNLAVRDSTSVEDGTLQSEDYIETTPSEEILAKNQDTISSDDNSAAISTVGLNQAALVNRDNSTNFPSQTITDEAKGEPITAEQHISPRTVEASLLVDDSNNEKGFVFASIDLQNNEDNVNSATSVSNDIADPSQNTNHASGVANSVVTADGGQESGATCQPDVDSEKSSSDHSETFEEPSFDSQSDATKGITTVEEPELVKRMSATDKCGKIENTNSSANSSIVEKESQTVQPEVVEELTSTYLASTVQNAAFTSGVKASEIVTPASQLDFVEKVPDASTAFQSAAVCEGETLAPQAEFGENSAYNPQLETSHESSAAPIARVAEELASVSHPRVAEGGFLALLPENPEVQLQTHEQKTIEGASPTHKPGSSTKAAPASEPDVECSCLIDEIKISKRFPSKEFFDGFMKANVFAEVIELKKSLIKQRVKSQIKFHFSNSDCVAVIVVTSDPDNYTPELQDIATVTTQDASLVNKPVLFVQTELSKSESNRPVTHYWPELFEGRGRPEATGAALEAQIADLDIPTSKSMSEYYATKIAEILNDPNRIPPFSHRVLKSIESLNPTPCRFHYLEQKCLVPDCKFSHAYQFDDAGISALAYLTSLSDCPVGAYCKMDSCIARHPEAP